MDNTRAIRVMLADPLVRAVLVAEEEDGSLCLQPIEYGKSVLNIETQLRDHLTSAPRSDAFLIQLRDWLDSWIEARAQTGRRGDFIVPGDGAWNIIHSTTLQADGGEQ